MIRPPRWCGLLAFFCLTLVGGCSLPISTGSFGEEREILEARGVRLEKEFSLGVGHSLVSMALENSDEKELQQLAKQIKRVEMATFRIGTGLRPGRREFAALEGRPGWQSVVRTRQGLNLVAVMIQCEGDRISELFIAALEGEELVFTRLTGNLERAIPLAMLAGHDSRFQSSTSFFPNEQPNPQSADQE